MDPEVIDAFAQTFIHQPMAAAHMYAPFLRKEIRQNK